MSSSTADSSGFDRGRRCNGCYERTQTWFVRVMSMLQPYATRSFDSVKSGLALQGPEPSCFLERPLTQILTLDMTL